MKYPISTYRLQFSPDFPFKKLEGIIDYLEELGISTIYAAPIFQSRKGSTHGYDVVNPLQINKEIGSLEDFENLANQLQQKKINWVQDIVPNHMAFDVENIWLKDIFELGPQSEYYDFYDINWNYHGWGKLMTPFLGKLLQEVIDKQEIEVILNDTGFYFQYYEQRYPLSAKSYSFILNEIEETEWLQNFIDFEGKSAEWNDLKAAFLREISANEKLNKEVQHHIQKINAKPEQLRELLGLQYFLLTHWQQTEKEINYRRFFTINDLICVKMENREVFEAYHQFIFEMIDKGLINGLRIDHIDGLFAPADYLKKLKKKLGSKFYLIVEKILEKGENLPEKWKTEGTSGYDFLAEVNHLFTNAENGTAFSEFYHKLCPKIPDFEELVFEKKQFIMKERMGGELNNLWFLLKKEELLPNSEAAQDELKWKEALTAFLAGFPVYRIYPEKFPLNDMEVEVVETAYHNSIKFSKGLDAELDFLKNIFLGMADKKKKQMLLFLKRCQQFSGPLAAKGVEDTSFYIYNRLISHNEVGDSPENFGLSVEGFHKKMLQRKQQYPLTLNATATHDTKRGEDARMRINFLSEIPKEWFQKVAEWQEIVGENAQKDAAPDPNEAYFIYQMLVGHFPLKNEEEEHFLKRTNEFLQKVLREAKVNSSWSEPNEAYEKGIFQFVENILKNGKFRKSFDDFQEKVAYFGALKSLNQLNIKATAPGIPDIYQGTELWDLSYVDPDNRRAVDYHKLRSYLSDLKEFKSSDLNEKINALKEEYKSGKIKMFTLYRLLNERKEHPELFQEGDYIALDIQGTHAKNFIAFARKKNKKWYIIAAPVLVEEVFHFENFKLKEQVLKETKIILPKNAPAEWTNIFTNEQLKFEKEIGLNALVSSFPTACLTNVKR